MSALPPGKKIEPRAKHFFVVFGSFCHRTQEGGSYECLSANSLCILFI